VASALHSVFKIASFRENQNEIVAHTMRGEDAFVLMRTGGGKSLTYQLPAYLERGVGKVTVVISPLVSLIEDQVSAMNSFCKGSAACLTASVKGSDLKRFWERLRDRTSGLCLVFVTPERVGNPKFNTTVLEAFRQLDSEGRLGRVSLLSASEGFCGDMQ